MQAVSVEAVGSFSLLISTLCGIYYGIIKEKNPLSCSAVRGEWRWGGGPDVWPSE